MTKRRERFEVGAQPGIELATFAGDITVAEGPAGVVEIVLNGSPDDFTVEQRGDTIVVQPQGTRRFGRSTDVTATVPPGTSAQLKCTSGDLLVEASVSRLDAAVASGDVRARKITGNAVIKSASGDTVVDDVDGRLEINTASGDAMIGRVGLELTMNTASGDARIDSVEGAVRLRTASGDVRIRRFDGTDLTAKTLAGNLTVGIPRRRRIDLDLQSLSGGLRNRLPEGDGSPPEKTISLSVKSVSGDLTLTGA